jgi:hypothetical protein
MGNVAMAQSIVDCLRGAVNGGESRDGSSDGRTIEKAPKCIVINVGDTIQSRRPVSWWRIFSVPWLQQTKNDIDPVDTSSSSKFISLYAYAKAMAEKVILGSDLVSASVRIDGFLSGHFGDTLITPALQYGGGLLHSWGVPVSIVHVEDVVRGALAVEYRLLDPDSRPAVSGQPWSVSGKEMTTLGMVYDYINKSNPHFRQIKVQPIIVLLISAYFSLRDLVFGSDKNTPKENALLCGAASTFTPQRFSVLQIAQIPNPANAERARSVLGYEPCFGIRDCLDGILREQKIMETRGV